MIVRKSIKIILLNHLNELLLLKADDPTTRGPNGKYRGPFWFMVGGEIETNETLQAAALRELYEETGLSQNDVSLGPVVWKGEYDLILNNSLKRLKQTFIVAHAKKTHVTLASPTDWEKKVVKDIKWFSLSDIRNCKEPVYPAVLADYLPDIIEGRFPKEPIAIDLSKQYP